MTLFGIIPVRLIDLFEIALVAVVLYFLYRMIRGTLSVSIFVGLMALYLVQFMVNATGMKILQAMFGALSDIYVLAAIIIFQPEIRRVLYMLGQNPLLRRFVSSTASQETVTETIAAVGTMSQQRIGALIAFKRYTGLRSYIETGELLQANISRDLLLSIFYERNPLHDGAVIIQGGRIEAARCILPVSGSRRLGTHKGLRHRAAVGLTEETDAFVVVVSEETGWISIADKGVMSTNIAIEELRSHLSEALNLAPPSKAVPTALDG